MITRTAAAALCFIACGADAEVRITLRATHAHPAAVREVWSTRFRHARDAELLPITRASAVLEPPGLVLEASLRVPSCEPATVDAMKLALIDLSTTRHALAIHRVAPERAETLATHLRETLGADASTPHDRPGQLIVAASASRLGPHLPTDGSVVFDEIQNPTGSSQRSILWVIDATPALDGRAVATAAPDVTSDHCAIDLTFTEEGGAALRALTDAVFGQHLVMLVDGRLALTPRVMERVSRTLRLELPASDAARTLTLARAIAASNFADAPTLVSIDASCSKP